MTEKLLPKEIARLVFNDLERQDNLRGEYRVLRFLPEEERLKITGNTLDRYGVTGESENLSLVMDAIDQEGAARIKRLREELERSDQRMVEKHGRLYALVVKVGAGVYFAKREIRGRLGKR